MVMKKVTHYVDENGCHICTSHKNDKLGYIRVERDHKRFYWHRYIYTQAHGEIPKGMVIRHTCDNPSCINIEHLILGTQKDNVHDMIERGRSNFYGGKHTGRRPNEILKNNIKKLRIERKLTLDDVANAVQVNPTYINRIERHLQTGSIRILKKIADFFNVSLDDLLKEDINGDN
jgi:DNA-binding XRE family transcriptional regulator